MQIDYLLTRPAAHAPGFPDRSFDRLKTRPVDFPQVPTIPGLIGRLAMTSSRTLMQVMLGAFGCHMWLPAPAPPPVAEEGGKRRPQRPAEKAKSASSHGRDYSIFDGQQRRAIPTWASRSPKPLPQTLTGQEGFSPCRPCLTRSNPSRKNELNLTGLVNAEQATKIGKLVWSQNPSDGAKSSSSISNCFLPQSSLAPRRVLVEGVLVKRLTRTAASANS